MTAHSSAQSPPKVAQSPAHTMCVPCKGDTLCAPSASTLGTLGSPTTDRQATTSRIDLNACITSDPDVIAFARACRDRFGPGVKLYPDRYGYLWGQP